MKSLAAMVHWVLSVCVIGVVLLPSTVHAQATPEIYQCAPAPLGNPLEGSMWNGWGADTRNTRYQSADAAGLAAADVERLTLKWAYGFTDDQFVSSQPTVVGGRIYIGTGPGGVRALDAETGCEYWRFPAHAIVRTAISIGPLHGTTPTRYAAYFGDLQGNVYAVDAETGTHLWTKRADVHPYARITGAPTLFEGRLYVPVSSLEEVATASLEYECCTFRGQVVAYDATTGDEIWRTYMIEDTPRPTRTSPTGVQFWGPAGAAIWSAPTIDPARGVLYVATGDAYTEPAADTSDAVVALDLETGRTVWVQQTTPNDVYVVGCDDETNRGSHCPEVLGPDYDFGQSPILRDLPNGRSILAIGQKSGIGWGMDPDEEGAILWQNEVGLGGVNGGLQWGAAADAEHVYFANSDIHHGPAVAGGLAAVNLETGQRAWYVRPPAVPCASPNDRRCVQAQSAAVTLIPGVVFSGATNGIMRAYATSDGRILWTQNTWQDYETVNGVPASGSSLDGGGATVVNGTVYMYSGYAMTMSGTPGNVLLAFATPNP